jgi:GAF domain-containing protein
LPKFVQLLGEHTSTCLNQGFGLKACRSLPIRDAQKEVIGIFSVYFDHARTPTDYELDLVAEAADITGLALLRDGNRKKQQERGCVDETNCLIFRA